MVQGGATYGRDVHSVTYAIAALGLVEQRDVRYSRALIGQTA